MSGELALRRGDEPVAALPGIAAKGPSHLLEVALAHSLSLPTTLRAASAFALLRNQFLRQVPMLIDIFRQLEAPLRNNMRYPSG